MSDWKTVLTHYLTQDGNFGEAAEVQDALDDMERSIRSEIEDDVHKAIVSERRPMNAIARSSVG